MKFINAAIPKWRTLNQRRRGEDPRMTRAVAARLAYPDISLHRALLMGGFKFSKNLVMHDTMVAPYTTNRNGSTIKYNKEREGGITDCDNILLSQRKKQLRHRLRLLVVYKNNKRDKTSEQKEGVHCSEGYNTRKNKSALVDATTNIALGGNSAAGMPSASERIGYFNKPRRSSNNNAPKNPSSHVVLQDAINDLKVLNEQESLLNQEIHALISSSSSTIKNTPDCFKPARPVINSYPATILVGEQPSTSLYQDVLNTAILSPSPSSNLNKRVQTDFLWLSHPSVSKGAPLSSLHHPQQPGSTNVCGGMTMSIPLATTNYQNDPRLRRLPYAIPLNEMKEQQLYTNALMMASRDNF
jgi:hypothetical protein